ncbi:PREDICTED: zinc finger protein Xfin-like [Branchiostoma belcheri]|uniref:Zinc finger protein Xfin-like n=1 Tax=Branchiostoma belcheri TaxID=7741 RepID=A0A6P4ZHS7_BRABE|nr:PREDICTED: zinc finger protein Xfin-like [Branchiostoma belcheri]
MEHSPVPLLIKQEPVNADVANQEAVGSGPGPESGEPPREDAWEDYPTHWQAVEGVVSIGQASRIRTPLRGRLYVCSECEYHATRADVIKHQRLHTRARPYVCLLCNFAGTQNSHLRSHFKRHHFTPLDEDNHMIIPQSHFICQECHIIFPTQEKLQTHLCESHTNEEQTPSNSEETENSDDMQVDSLQTGNVGKQNGALESVQHVNNVLHRNNEQNSPLRSDSCATSKHMISSTVPPTDDGVSMNSAHVIHMSQNDSDFSSKGTTFNHDGAYLQPAFAINQEEQITASSKESVTNTPCSFTQSHVFEQRERRTCGNPSSIEDSVSVTQDCAIVGSSNSSEHVPPSEGLATVGSSSKGRKTFTCSQCGYKGGKKDVQKHLTVHTGFRPYVCLQCGHTTAQNNHMRKHFQRIHPGQEAEFDVRTDEFYICSSCLYFFLSQETFSAHFDKGTCVRDGTELCSDTMSPNNVMLQNQTLFNPQAANIGTRDYEEEHNNQLCETSFSFSNTFEEGHHLTQRNRQRKNAGPKCAIKTDGTISNPQNTQSDVINHFRRSINVENNYKELRSEEAMSWSTELSSYEPTVSNVNGQNHMSLPSLQLVETRNETKKAHFKGVQGNAQNRTSRRFQNSTSSVPSRISSSQQNGQVSFSQEGSAQMLPGFLQQTTTHISMDGTGYGTIASPTVGNAAAVPLHSLKQNCDEDVHTTNTVPRNIRKAARRSLKKYTQVQNRQRMHCHQPLYTNRRKPIQPFVWHFQGRSYITYEIAGKTSRSLPKVDRQMACNFCPYKTSKKELLRLHMRRHLWMS